MSSRITPVTRSLPLCDSHVGYPPIRRQIVGFAQLTGGLGDDPFFLDIRSEQTGDQVRSRATRTGHLRTGMSHSTTEPSDRAAARALPSGLVRRLYTALLKTWMTARPFPEAISHAITVPS